MVVSLFVFILGSLLAREARRGGDIKHITQRAANYFASDWVTYNATAGKFRILFPKYPTIDTQQVPIPGMDVTIIYTQYTAEVDSARSYVVVFAEYPSQMDTSQPERILESVVNGSVVGVEGGRLVSSQFTTFRQYKAVDYMIQNGTVTQKYRSIIIDHSLYTIGALFDNVSVDDQSLSKFWGSFELI